MNTVVLLLVQITIAHEYVLKYLMNIINITTQEEGNSNKLLHDLRVQYIFLQQKYGVICAGFCDQLLNNITIVFHLVFQI